MFKDKVVFITGGASGLGRILVDEFVRENARVFFTYRNSEEKAKKIVEKYGETVYAVKADASVYEEAQAATDECVKHFGTIDVLVNNAASAKDNSLEKITPESFRYTIDNVLGSTFNYSKCAAEIMKEKHYGHIINIGSINGLRGREGSVAYSAAKAGIIGLTKTMAKELGKYEICCNVVAPGFIDTDGQQNTSELIKKMVLDECAIRRLTTPVEVANMVLFLASDKARNITGQVYKIDCGQYI
jgi:3-oxoacyl-[acyl-carrier protein] reductase